MKEQETKTKKQSTGLIYKTNEAPEAPTLIAISTENIASKLMKIQCALKAPKNQYNGFGKYKYRSLEDITEAVKPLLLEYECALTICDEIVAVGERVYVKAIATLMSGEEILSVNAWAREPLIKKGMDEAQITGATSSYARKYCLNGLFAIDDTKDADAIDNKEDDNKEDDNKEDDNKEDDNKEDDNKPSPIYRPPASDNIETVPMSHKDKLISAKQLKILQDEIKKRDVDVANIQTYCKIKTLTAMPADQYEIILGYLRQKSFKKAA